MRIGKKINLSMGWMMVFYVTTLCLVWNGMAWFQIHFLICFSFFFIFKLIESKSGCVYTRTHTHTKCATASPPARTIRFYRGEFKTKQCLTI